MTASMSAQLAELKEDHIQQRVRYLQSELSLDKETTAELTSRLYEIKPQHSAADWHKTRQEYEIIFEDVLGIARVRQLGHSMGVQCFAPETVDIKFAGTTNTEATATIDLSPNPTDDWTLINYSTSEDTDITIKLTDNTGALISTLIDRFHTKGDYEYRLDANNLRSELYLVVMRAGRTLLTKKLIVQK